MSQLSHPKPELSVHFMDVGQGDMTLLITPSKTIVYDCRITEEDEDRILSYLEIYVPSRTIGGETRKWIDWFICSHRDSDHIHGLEALNRDFPVRGIVDPGTTSGSTDGGQNKYYMGLRRRVKEGYGDSALLEPKPSTNPLFDFDGVKFYCLCSGIDDPVSEDGHYGNNVFQVEYAGKRVLLTGDSDWRAWKDKIMPAFKDSGLLATTVLTASHHGSRSFFVDSSIDEGEAWDDAYEDHLAAINPKMTIISCGPKDHHNHPNETTLKKYRAATAYEQVYLTRELKTLVGQFHSDGWWTVTPSRFLQGWEYAEYATSGKEIHVRCWECNGDTRVNEVKSGSILQVGRKLQFEVQVPSVPVASTVFDFRFEVSNGGAGPHMDRDDIYSEGKGTKKQPNTFKRELRYVGMHLLRCRVSGPGMKGQSIFVVQGRV